jgi:hypothetical protein
VLTVTLVPEPMSVLPLMTGLIAVAIWQRRRQS